MQNRQSWDAHFMGLAKHMSEMSTCLRRKVGAVAVKNRQLLLSGFNGAPSGVTHCDKRGCIREKNSIPSGTHHELCWGAHAEQNIINHAAKYGVELAGATIYCTHMPCSMCAKSIINAGIAAVIFEEGYPDDLTKTMFNEARIAVVRRSMVKKEEK